MSPLLATAAVLAFGIGLAHSFLGERYILIRLFRRQDLPTLFGDDRFTRRTLRFAWHLTSVAWWGFAAVLALAALPEGLTGSAALQAVAWTFVASATITFVSSRGRHMAWIVFLAIAILVWLGA